MELTITQKELADRIARLLAESLIDKSMKDKIIDRLDTMSEDKIFQLLGTLENERFELKRLNFDLNVFNKKFEEGRIQLEAQQKKVIDQLIARRIRRIEDQINLEQIKSKIDNQS